MTDYWVIYDLENGEAICPGSGSPGMAEIQRPEPGRGLVITNAAINSTWPPHLPALRAAYVAVNDLAAEAVRARFITALPGQVGAYSLKAAAARRWLADNSAPTWMLEPEATGRRMTIAALAEEVIQREEQWEIIAGQIEGLRQTAKTLMDEATTFGAIVEAAKIDWAVLDALA